MSASTQAIPLWTIAGPEFGSWRWLRNFSIAVLLSVTLILMGCGFASFVAGAEADLPVIVHIVQNITNVIAPGVSSAIQQGGTLALGILAVLCGAPALGAATCDATSLVGQYQVATDAQIKATLLQKIQAGLSTLSDHLSQMLNLANGLPQNIALAISVAVGIALSTVTALISLLPITKLPTLAAQKAAVKKLAKTVPLRNAKQIKSAYNSAIAAQFPGAVLP
jgi:hypothetical protein